jgi:hypothetical protein
MDELEARARAALDGAHGADPGAPGRPTEAEYADRLEAWVARLVKRPSLPLRLAARAQHLERWVLPRGDFPEGRGGYLRWRSAVHARQADRARGLIEGAGGDAILAGRVAELVGKKAPRADPDAQALEDAACLVFLETELAAFQRQHERPKVIDVVRKTWTKMSPAAQDAARRLAVPPEVAALVGEALG